MYPHENDMLGRLWFPVARNADADSSAVPAQLLGQRVVIYRTSGGLLEEFAACQPVGPAAAGLEQDRIGV